MPQKKISILLVEDEENLHEALKLNLEMEGYEVTSAFDGPEALKAVENEFFDLIIMDVMLPELDGFGVCEAIRLHNATVPILFLSAKNANEDKIFGLKRGADDYIRKPFEIKELLLRINNIKRLYNIDTGQRVMIRSDVVFDMLSNTVENGQNIYTLTKK